MAVQKIFVNLPVKDLNKSMEFFSKLGFEFNPQFTTDTAASMVISETIYSMLLVEDHFKKFTKKEIADSSKTTEVLVALAVESKEEVDEMINKVREAGGKPTDEPQDYGFMYQWSFEDIDGHIWELFYMDPSTVQ